MFVSVWYGPVQQGTNYERGVQSGGAVRGRLRRLPRRRHVPPERSQPLRVSRLASAHRRLRQQPRLPVSATIFV